jgi:hypothetical protein
MSSLQATEFVRTVSGPDAVAASLTQTIVSGIQTLRLGATTDTPGATLALSVYFTNSLGNPLTVQKVTFTSGPAPDWSAAGASATTPVPNVFVGVPSYDPCWPLSGAKGYVVKVDSISAGTWTYGGTTA